jgi:predicted secreted acid phosphatase
MDFYTDISSFEEIDISPDEKTLVLCDIDETLLRFQTIHKNWWSDEVTHEDWSKVVENEDPIHTDKSGFENMIEKLETRGGKLVFITARESRMRDMTLRHLLHLDVKSRDVYFCGHSSKGMFIKNKKLIKGYDKIIFIDDLNWNLDSVREIFGEKIKYYRFVYSEKN